MAERLIEVREAAAVARRHPETIRRWVWSGRLAARRRGNRLLVARSDVEALTAHEDAALTLRGWAEHARSVRSSETRTVGRSAADLVIDDRAMRKERPASHARR